MKLTIYEIPSEKVQEVKKILETEDHKDEKGVMQVNEFARNGYILREAKIIGIEKNASYLYIEAGDDFLKKNEQKLPKLKKLEGEEFKKVKEKIEGEQNNSAAGVGLIFGDI